MGFVFISINNFKAIMLIIVILVVTESSVIKELVADVEVMEKVCD